jgi:hypothetical protein
MIETFLRKTFTMFCLGRILGRISYQKISPDLELYDMFEDINDLSTDDNGMVRIRKSHHISEIPIDKLIIEV